MTPLKLSRPFQSGKWRLAANPMAHINVDARIVDPLSQVMVHLFVKASKVAVSTLVLKIVSFLIWIFLSTCAKYSRSSSEPGYCSFHDQSSYTSGMEYA